MVYVNGSARHRLSQLAVYWINCDQSTDRAETWLNRTAPLFKFNERVRATFTDEISDADATAGVEDWRRTFNENRELMTAANKPQGEKFRMSVAKATAAIRLSHLDALRAGLDGGDERFMVMEDDVVPRDVLRHEYVPAPPTADVAIWSGGLPMAAIATDDEVYAAGRPVAWRALAHPFNSLGAGAYEVTRYAAVALIDEVSGHGMPWDHAWGFAFRRLTAMRAVPNVFAQRGVSIKNGKERTQVLERNGGKIRA